MTHEQVSKHFNRIGARIRFHGFDRFREMNPSRSSTGTTVPWSQYGQLRFS